MVNIMVNMCLQSVNILHLKFRLSVITPAITEFYMLVFLHYIHIEMIDCLVLWSGYLEIKIFKGELHYE